MIPEDLVYDYHERAFGEELARVNFLPREERWQYVRTLWARIEERAGRDDGVELPHGPDRVWGGDPEPFRNSGE